MAEERVLIVEDDLITARHVQDCLQALGYSVTAVAVSGSEAIDKAAETRPDVALIDLGLKDMAGLKLLSAIKERCPDTECIVLTGHVSESSAIEAVNLGAYGYVSRPYDPEQLLVSIQRALEKYEEERL